MEKVRRVIKFNQNAWLKPNIYMNTDLRKSKKLFWKISVGLKAYSYLIERSSRYISILIWKYEYLIVEEILPSTQRQIIEQSKFTYSPLGKASKKQTKTIED